MNAHPLLTAMVKGIGTMLLNMKEKKAFFITCVRIVKGHGVLFLSVIKKWLFYEGW